MPFVFIQRLDTAQWRWMKNQNPIIGPSLFESVPGVGVSEAGILIWEPKKENAARF